MARKRRPPFPWWWTIGAALPALGLGVLLGWPRPRGEPAPAEPEAPAAAAGKAAVLGDPFEKPAWATRLERNPRGGPPYPCPKLQCYYFEDSTVMNVDGQFSSSMNGLAHAGHRFALVVGRGAHAKALPLAESGGPSPAGAIKGRIEGLDRLPLGMPLWFAVGAYQGEAMPSVEALTPTGFPASKAFNNPPKFGDVR